MAPAVIPTHDYLAGETVVSQLRFFDPDDVAKIWKVAENKSVPGRSDETRPASAENTKSNAPRARSRASSPGPDDSYQYDIFDEKVGCDAPSEQPSHPHDGGETGSTVEDIEAEPGSTT